MDRPASEPVHDRTPSPAQNDYQKRWSPQGYLRQYYMTPRLTSDDYFSLPLLVKWLRGTVAHRAIEVGCGPVPYRTNILAYHADEIHLADYLESNLNVVRLWLENHPEQHNWDRFLRETHAMVDPDAVFEAAACKERLRRKITRLLHCDVRQQHPLGVSASYDLVTSIYCTEAITDSIPAWERLVANLSSLVSSKGRLFIAAMRNSHSYQVLDVKFTATPVNEHDWQRLLPRLGYDPARTHIEVASIPDWVDEAFDSINVVMAIKR